MGNLQESYDAPLPSFKRVEPGSVDIPIGKFPKSPNCLPTHCQPIAQSVVEQFNQALTKKDFAGIAKLFSELGYWRDHLAVSWELRTVKSPAGIAEFLKGGCRLVSAAIDTSSDFRTPHIGNIDAFGDVKGIEFCITINTDVGTGRGLVRLGEEEGQWRIFTFFTTLQELRGHEEPIYHRRTPGVTHGGDPNRKNWLEKRQIARGFEDREPKVLIIGMYTSSWFVPHSKIGHNILTHRGRCWSRWVDCCCSAQNARRRHVDDRCQR